MNVSFECCFFKNLVDDCSFVFWRYGKRCSIRTSDVVYVVGCLVLGKFVWGGVIGIFRSSVLIGIPAYFWRLAAWLFRTVNV